MKSMKVNISIVIKACFPYLQHLQYEHNLCDLVGPTSAHILVCSCLHSLICICVCMWLCHRRTEGDQARHFQPPLWAPRREVWGRRRAGSAHPATWWQVWQEHHEILTELAWRRERKGMEEAVKEGEGQKAGLLQVLLELLWWIVK